MICQCFLWDLNTRCHGFHLLPIVFMFWARSCNVSANNYAAGVGSCLGSTVCNWLAEAEGLRGSARSAAGKASVS